MSPDPKSFNYGDSRLVRLPEVKHRTGLSRATIYRLIARGKFPPQIQLSVNVVAWYECDIDHWISDPIGWRGDRPTVLENGTASRGTPR